MSTDQPAAPNPPESDQPTTDEALGAPVTPAETEAAPNPPEDASDAQASQEEAPAAPDPGPWGRLVNRLDTADPRIGNEVGAALGETGEHRITRLPRILEMAASSMGGPDQAAVGPLITALVGDADIAHLFRTLVARRLDNAMGMGPLAADWAECCQQHGCGVHDGQMLVVAAAELIRQSTPR